MYKMVCVSVKLEVYNAVSSPRIVTMANQVLTISVTENVSVGLLYCVILYVRLMD